MHLVNRFYKGLTGWQDLNFSEGGSFCIKKKLKSEIFNDQKSLETKILFSVLTKNINWGMWKELEKEGVVFSRGGWYPNAHYDVSPALNVFI